MPYETFGFVTSFQLKIKEDGDVDVNGRAVEYSEGSYSDLHFAKKHAVEEMERDHNIKSIRIVRCVATAVPTVTWKDQ